MQTTLTSDQIFFDPYQWDRDKAERITLDALSGMDDGELFLEFQQSENLLFDDGRLKNAGFNTLAGFGLRAVKGEATAFAHASDLSEAALRKAAETVRSIKSNGLGGNVALLPGPRAHSHPLYHSVNPLEEFSFARKVKLLQEIDAYVRAKDKRVRQVTVSLGGEWQAIEVIRPHTATAHDIRPLVRLNITVLLEENGRTERGTNGGGGRRGYADHLKPEVWQNMADEALRQASVNMEAKPAPAGAMDVVLGNGWPGVLLHEAVGHGLEGDFNRKETSCFSGKIGEQVAAKGVTVVDDGTLEGLRGSLTVDDEGTPTQCNTLIEDGILVGYMQDRMNARLMGVNPTGNGRRESYAHPIMPRMTNTYMLSGDKTPEEIISTVKNGVYAANFGGGQVDITSGKFVFSASEAYRIENGKVTYPIKGATLIGQGAEVMKNIAMVGNDTKLDPGIGTCGKDGQSVPVGVGQPTLLVKGITVGGTEV